jgi:hypothetical protein
LTDADDRQLAAFDHSTDGAQSEPEHVGDLMRGEEGRNVLEGARCATRSPTGEATGRDAGADAPCERLDMAGDRDRARLPGGGLPPSGLAFELSLAVSARWVPASEW